MPDEKKLDAVFEGGGVKGIGLVGAVTVTEAKGYVFKNVAGTSAGAIVACLIAAGYNAAELKTIMDALDYTRFKDKDLVDEIPLLGPLLSLVLEKGIYEGRYFEEWLRELLKKKGIHTFADLLMPGYEDTKEGEYEYRYKFKLRVIASDISLGRMLKLPQDIKKYGMEPEDLDVARAVRMSMSIPFFFEPVVLRDETSGISSYIVDGGILSNFPVWLFDEKTANPAWPTLGYRLVDSTTEGKEHTINGPLTLLAALFSTMMQAHDARHIEETDFKRTIPIDTFGVRGTDFNLSGPTRKQLYQSGVDAAEKFFQEKPDFFEENKKDRQAELLKQQKNGRY